MTAAWRLVPTDPWNARTRNPALALAVLAHLGLLAALGVSALLRVAPPPEVPFGPTPVFAVLLEPPPIEPVLEEKFKVKIPRGDPAAPQLPRAAEPPPKVSELPETGPPPGAEDLENRPIEGLAAFGEPTGPGGGGDHGTGNHNEEGPGWGDRNGDDDLLSPLNVGGPVLAPVLLIKVEPEYPHIAIVTRTPGRVIVAAVIARDGTVEDAEIVSSTSRMFDEAALQAVRQWRYAPARLNGRPVRVAFRVRVEFTMN